MNQHLYQRIKRYILDHRHPRGEALSERKLAERFGVSRSPVREVLRAIEQEGFIRIIPNRGSFVDTLTLEDIREIFELREAFDTFAVRRAASLLRPKELRRLQGSFRALVKKGEKASFAEMRDAWSGLFNVVVRSLNNGRFSKIYSDLFEQVEVVRRFSSSSPERIAEALRLGMELVRALMEGDPERAEAVLKLHRQKSREAIFKALSSAEFDTKGKIDGRKDAYSLQ